jgi:hypothetical protein
MSVNAGPFITARRGRGVMREFALNGRSVWGALSLCPTCGMWVSWSWLLLTHELGPWAERSVVLGEDARCGFGRGESCFADGFSCTGAG